MDRDNDRPRERNANLNKTAFDSGRESDDVGLVFVAYNKHGASCGTPPGLRTTDGPGSYHGYFENRHGEQFVFTFDRATRTGTISGGDLDWGHPKSFTLAQLEKDLAGEQPCVAVEGNGGPIAMSSSYAARRLGRSLGLSGEDEVAWLRACLEACTFAFGPSGTRAPHSCT